ncbi:hypothetical protein, partial [Serratia fonticola]
AVSPFFALTLLDQSPGLTARTLSSICGAKFFAPLSERSTTPTSIQFVLVPKRRFGGYLPAWLTGL